MSEGLIIRKCEIVDVESVKDIEIDCNLSPWLNEDYKSEVDREDSLFIVAEKDYRIVGFVLARLIMKDDYYLSNSNINSGFDQFNQAEIYNIGIYRKYQRQGIGGYIFEKLLNYARELNIKEIWLDVRKSNKTALKFYKNIGFLEVYTRKNFYTSPTEDAIVLNLPI